MHWSSCVNSLTTIINDISGVDNLKINLCKILKNIGKSNTYPWGLTKDQTNKCKYLSFNYACLSGDGKKIFGISKDNKLYYKIK